jgi:putative Mg2+ transporter-C (MgtC) family protein
VRRVHTLSTLEFTARLAAGLGFGALIGIERQWRARMAGLRTNALVAAGATLFVLYNVASGTANSTQVAAYVVSGIGFLGGGVILRDGFNVRGLNTAATLWCSAAVGVLCASGHLAFAAIATAAVLAVHVLGRPLGRLIDHDNPAEEDEDLRPYKLHITCRPKNEAHIRALLVQHTTGGDVVLRGIYTDRDQVDSDTRLTAQLLLDGDAPTVLERLIARLSIEPGIHAVHWHSADDPDLEKTATAQAQAVEA